MKRFLQLAGVAAATFVVALPLGGFIWGMVTCIDCDGRPLGRVFMGVLGAIFSTFTLGFPWRNEGGVGEPFNAWPYILPTWAALFCVGAVIDWWLLNRGPKTR
jgi:hypothetical protein